MALLVNAFVCFHAYAEAGKGDAYYKRMMANKAERSGRFLDHSTVPTQKFKDSGNHDLSDGISLIETYLQSAVESYWTGRPEQPWLSDSNWEAELSGVAQKPPLSAAYATSRNMSSSSFSNESLMVNGDDMLLDPDDGSVGREKKRRVKRGITIPAPLGLEGELHVLHEGL
jgi:hypothetical protein